MSLEGGGAANASPAVGAGFSAAPDLKPSRYNQACEALLPGYTLVFNARTGALLELSDADYARARPALEGRTGGSTGDPTLDERLQRAGCLIPSTTDEIEALRRARRAASQADDVLGLTIAPTMQCNFRCTYCFEEHRQEFMTREVEDALIHFVQERSRGKRAISVTWFGGEPLMHLSSLERVQRAIDDIAARQGLGSTRALITNGYLLTEPTIQRLQALGEWDFLQVTIDGPPLLHDGRRFLVKGAGTWQRVASNVRTALDAGLPIVVRVNIDRGSTHIVREALDSLIKADVVPRASVYLGSIIDSTPSCSHMGDAVLSRKQFADAQMELQKALLELGFPSGISLPRPRCTLCTADHESGYTIAPTGLLFKCWNEVHMSADVAVGSLVGSPVPRAEENAALWRGYDPFAKSECLQCHALPSCLGGCPWEARRLEADHGDCGQYRFHSTEMIQVAHAEQAIRKHLRVLPD